MVSAIHQPIERTILDNGLTVLTIINPAADIITARIFVKAGTIREQAHQSGLSHLLAAVLTRGTAKLSALEIAEQVESTGASLNADTASDYLLMSLKTVSADFAEILALASQLLQYPSFPSAEIELERRLALQAIRSQHEQPYAIALEQLRRVMYQQHPYAQSGLGTAETVANIDQSDLELYHQTYFRPDNLVISVAGRITHSEVLDLIQHQFGTWQNPSQPLPRLVLDPLQVDGQTVATSQPTHQSIVMLAYLAPAVEESDYAAIKLLSSYLGNGLSSRLFVELREKRGLAYEVSAFYPTRLSTSQFVTYMGTAPNNTQIALEGLHAEVDRLCTQCLTEDELSAAKNKLLGQYALGKQTNAQLAQIFGWYETLGLGLAFDQQFQMDISAVTVEHAQAAALKYLTTPYISIVGPIENSLQP
jgi:zinc protease